MTIKQVKELLEKTGFPVAYMYFATEQQAPYICFNCLPENTTYADGVRYFSSSRFKIQLYTDKKDISAESILEDVLADFNYDKSEDEFIQDIEKFLTTYEIEV